MHVVLASGNAGKLAEFQSLFTDTPLKLTNLSSAAPDFEMPAETGTTFIENALIKAHAVAQATGCAALADDSGLVVPALNGAPGIYSARYAGRHGDDAANNRKLIEALAGKSLRKAYFYCAIVLLRNSQDPTPIIATAAWHGEILDTPRGEQGFGYDPLFWLADLNMTSAELPRDLKNRLSHRGQATAALLQEIRASL
ncbi:MAG: RdgB/HAM1 family non-canonical purine NTP pyrophosphatase [bacterium]